MTSNLAILRSHLADFWSACYRPEIRALYLAISLLESLLYGELSAELVSEIRGVHFYMKVR
jgi:hypothetical protein